MAYDQNQRQLAGGDSHPKVYSDAPSAIDCHDSRFLTVLFPLPVLRSLHVLLVCIYAARSVGLGHRKNPFFFLDRYSHRGRVYSQLQEITSEVVGVCHLDDLVGVLGLTFRRDRSQSIARV